MLSDFSCKCHFLSRTMLVFNMSHWAQLSEILSTTPTEVNSSLRAQLLHKSDCLCISSLRLHTPPVFMPLFSLLILASNVTKSSNSSGQTEGSSSWVYPISHNWLSESESTENKRSAVTSGEERSEEDLNPKMKSVSP